MIGRVVKDTSKTQSKFLKFQQIFKTSTVKPLERNELLESVNSVDNVEASVRLARLEAENAQLAAQVIAQKRYIEELESKINKKPEREPQNDFDIDFSD